MWKTRGNQRKLPRSTNFFDDPEMHAEDMELRANQRYVRKQAEAICGRHGQPEEAASVAKKSSSGGATVNPSVRSYDGKVLCDGAGSQKRLSSEYSKKDRPLGETVVFEPVIKSGTIDVGGPVRIKRP